MSTATTAETLSSLSNQFITWRAPLPFFFLLLLLVLLRRLLLLLLLLFYISSTAAAAAATKEKTQPARLVVLCSIHVEEKPEV